ncbi:hypothetical protein DITRI_Ditri03aG0096200 [Diplodiscus trichospermus]
MTTYRFTLENLGCELEDDQLPNDYEEEVEQASSRGRIRCCYGLIDRQQPDSLKLAELLEQKLFQQPSSYTQVPEQLKQACKHSILEFIETAFNYESTMSGSKFLIIVQFGVFTRTRSNGVDDDGEVEDDIDEGEELLLEVTEEIGFKPASKAAIEGLEKVSGLGNNECVICLGMEKEDEAKRMPWPCLSWSLHCSMAGEKSLASIVSLCHATLILHNQYSIPLIPICFVLISSIIFSYIFTIT